MQNHYLSVNGVKVRYLEEGTGPTILFIHGFGVTAETWRHNIPAFESKFRVLAPDLIGHGRSERPEDASYSMRSYVEFLQSFLKLLDVRDYIALGHSMGGLIAIHLALEDVAGNTKALVLEDSAGLGGGPGFSARMAFLSYLLRMNLLGPSEKRVRGWLEKGFYSDPSKISDDAVKRALESWKDAKYRRMQRKTAMGLRKDERRTSQFIDRIPVPTLIIWGEEDRQISARVAYRAAERMRDCHVEVIPRCGHTPHSERTEEFNLRVLAFLNGVS